MNSKQSIFTNWHVNSSVINLRDFTSVCGPDPGEARKRIDRRFSLCPGCSCIFFEIFPLGKTRCRYVGRWWDIRWGNLAVLEFLPIDGGKEWMFLDSVGVDQSLIGFPLKECCDNVLGVLVVNISHIGLTR